MSSNPNAQHILPAPPLAGQLPNPTPEMLNNLIWEAIWQVVKDWDINVPDYYHGYMGGTGSHVTLIYEAVMSAKLK